MLNNSDAPSVLFIQNYIPHYRVPLYNELSKIYKKFTVCHSGALTKSSKDFNEIQLPTFRKGRLIFFRGLHKIVNDYDVVVAMFDISWISIMALLFTRNRKYKIILWGIGVSTAKGFDADKRINKLRFFLAGKADAVVFYSDYPVEKYIQNKFIKEKLFVAHNTVFIDKKIEKKPGSYFVFVGSVQLRKNIEELIHATQILKDKNFNTLVYIIGDGPHKQVLENLVKELKLQNAIQFLGQMEGNSLSLLLSEAIASISPGQAGLSVLESMGNGVPFITKTNAITGGEKFNILNGYNGFLYNGNELDLSVIMEKLLNDSELKHQLSENAFTYYFNNRTIKNMADGFVNAINYTLRK